MHIGSIHVDPQVLANQGLGHAHGDGKAARPRAHAPQPGSFAQALLQAERAGPVRPSAQHLAQVHAAQHHGRVRRRHVGDPQFRADDEAYADAVAMALGHGHRPKAPQLHQTQGLVMASMGMFPMVHESSSDDEE